MANFYDRHSKVQRSGQVVIPKEFREFLGLKDGDTAIFIKHDGMIIIESVKSFWKNFNEKKYDK